MKTIKSRTTTILKADLEVRSEQWLVGLSYGECNDYASSVVARVQFETAAHVRFETVARIIRDFKAQIRAKNVQA